MWNNNNPYVYSDPSGYCATTFQPLCNLGGAIAAGTATAANGLRVAAVAVGAAVSGPVIAGTAGVFGFLLLTMAPAGESNWKAHTPSGGPLPTKADWGTARDPRVQGMTENPNRPGSWGVTGSNGKFEERIRFDRGQPGKPGNQGKDHEHHNGEKEHIPPQTSDGSTQQGGGSQ